MRSETRKESFKMELTILLILNVFALAYVHPCLSDENWSGQPPFNDIPARCRPQQICLNSDTQEGLNGRCDCDERCSEYGTCCIDSQHFSLGSVNASVGQLQCSEAYGASWGAFMITSCSPLWKGDDMTRSLCERKTVNDSDPLAVTPVTNKVSNVTYRNYFCAVCNLDHQDAVLWNIFIAARERIEPPDIKVENLVAHLVYNNTENKWGIWKESNSSDFKFVPIHISVEIPPSVSSVVKKCETKWKSSCPAIWNDTTVRELCEAYILPTTVLVDQRLKEYKNPHCAICNDVTNFEAVRCRPAPAVFSTRPPTLSFTLLLDIYPSSGNNPANQCSSAEVYDPFFKKCRTLVCSLPGYTIQDGKCIKY